MKMKAERQKTSSDRGTPSHGSHFEVMVVRGMGKVRNFKISSRILIFGSIFLILYLLASLYVIYDYLDKRRTNSAQSERLVRVYSELQDVKRKFYRSEQHLVLLEEYIERLKAGNETPQVPERPAEIRSEGAASAGKAKPAETAKPSTRKEPGKHEEPAKRAETGKPEEPAKRAETGKPASENEVGTQETAVDIQDFEFERKGAEFTVRLKVVNLNGEGNPAAGYVHLIAMDRESEPPRMWTYPKVALQDGLPVNYKRGERFVIRRFRKIRGEYYLTPETETPSSMRVVVYNKSGVLILDKEFDLEKP